MTSVPDDARLAAWRNLLESHAFLTRALAADLERETGLPLNWYDVLLQLDEADGHRLRMQELADRVLLSQSGLSRLVDRMVRAGLVQRAHCPSDRRGTFAALTPEGKDELRRAAPVHLRGIQKHFGRHLADADVRALCAALSRVLVPPPAAGC
ncbi:MAG: MarR family transcriptional regulator [Nitriliruptorales bacterium]|nr:MarR family transcriptional regulator [Nitriliruptorales bacterium]